MGTEKIGGVSRRGFGKLAVGAAVSAATRAASAQESTSEDSYEVRGGYDYDVVIVGAGAAGALAASKLAEKGLRVLILEAGKKVRHPSDNVDRFYEATIKIPESPWLEPATNPNSVPKPNRNANSPTVLDMGHTRFWLGKTNYLIQHNSIFKKDEGSKYDPRCVDPKTFIFGNVKPEYVPFNSTYTRLGGGSTNHWLGIALRHVPNDFRLKKNYAKESGDAEFEACARDWPISYGDLEEWYTKAEWEVGVAGDTKYDDNLGVRHSKHPDREDNRVYPMPAIKLSYQDTEFEKALEGEVIKGRSVSVHSIPSARNSEDRHGRPKCQGNTSCIPVCPIQAKYDSTVHLKKAVTAGARIEYQSVAYRVEVEEADGNRVSKIWYRQWIKGEPEDLTVTARKYVLAAHAIETAKLLLISPWKKSDDAGPGYVCVANSSDQVGRNLMDHIIYIAWGWASAKVYPYRGPLTIAGINDFRDKAQEVGADGMDEDRKKRAAFRISIANDSWSWPVPPEKNAEDLIDDVVNLRIAEILAPDRSMTEVAADLGLAEIDMASIKSRTYQSEEMTMVDPLNNKPLPFGKRILTHVREGMQRQIRVGAEMEALPLPDSRVTVSNNILANGDFAEVPDDEKDFLGIPKPQVHYRISEYTKRGFHESVEVLDSILVQMGAQDAGEYGNKIKSRIVLDQSDCPPDTRDEKLPGRDRKIENFTVQENTANVIRHKGKVYEYGGAGHIMGTYRMGDNPNDSVCNSDCRTWDHDNLYLLGSGVFPSSGTANPTLTIMALALRAADNIACGLASEDEMAR